MADRRGFAIKDMLRQVGVELNTAPPHSWKVEKRFRRHTNVNRTTVEIVTLR